MLYKDDWDQARERMGAWWAGELLDRAVLQATAPRKGSPGRHAWDWLNSFRHRDRPEMARQEFEEYCRNTYFGAESFPNLWVNLGPGILAAYLGCTPRADDNTIWFSPPAGELSWEEVLALELDPEDYWWKKTRELTELAVQWADNRFFAGITDLNSVHDVLCHLLGTQRLLFDLIDHPDEFKQACSLVNRLWLFCYDELTSILQSGMEGSSNWMSIWFPGRGGDVQCDFSAMISPRMFEEFVLPYLQEQCRRLDHTIYHMDGPGQIPHLELLLDIPELDGIQWIPGAGNSPVGSPEWFPMYRRIQQRGKLLVLQGMEKQDVEGVLEGISSRGLLIGTECASEKEARELIVKCGAWTRD
ncbi:MAG: hypothetical protein JXQ83_00270 [Candidatus Glassbacteria bacterium]|nr:hypothetical protein [Candidatus Glassbacteria bacterium]